MAAEGISFLVAEPATTIRLYVHYPFCEEKCGYCAFPSACCFDLEQQYLDSLLREASLFHTSKQIISIYIGGGTPSLIKGKTLSQLISRLQQSAPFSCNPEITLELRPEHYTQDRIDEFVDAGVNRISIGVQSFLPEKLAAFRRPSLPAQNVLLPKDMRVSVDIIIGTKFDDKQLEQELDALKRFMPHHNISIYPLSLEKGSAYFKKKPSFLSSRIGEQYDTCEKTLSSIGYIHYESSNFALGEESICIHNLGYWNNEDYIGFGVSANSRIGCTLFEREFNIYNYINTIKQGQ